MNFTFFSPVNIIFGAGTADNLLNAVQSLAQSSTTPFSSFPGKVLVVTGKNSSRAENIIHMLHSSNIGHEIMCQNGEPTVEGIIPEVEKARHSHIDMVIAQGGGSVIDAGKAMAALITNTQDVMNYLEVIGQGASLTRQPLPMIALPTTAGTGAEATCNAVLSSLEHKVKVSLRSSTMYPDIAIVDPMLCLSMPPLITAATGMDALTQLIESFTSRFSNPFTDALCRDGIIRVGRSLKKAWEQPDNLAARTDMSLAGLYSGITLSNAKLGAVHGIAGPMGGMSHAPHGMICARLLTSVMRANITALASQAPPSPAQSTPPPQDLTIHNPMTFNTTTLDPTVSNPVTAKYLEIARMLSHNPKAGIQEGLEWIQALVEQMQIKQIWDMGLKPEQLPLLARKALQASSMKGNPVKLTAKQIENILMNSTKIRNNNLNQEILNP